MPIGKNSITKRVAAPAAPAKEENIAPELVATTAAAPKVEAKKSPAKKTTSSSKKPAAKKPATKKETVTEKLTPPEVEHKEKLVDTAVIANIAPETVAAVIGHEENKGFEKVQLGDKMPVHLL